MLAGPVTSLPMLRPEVARADWRATLAGQRRWDSRFWRWLNLAAWSRRFEIAM
jgi:asparagine synthase (glutamine-hydrolysing)